MEASATARPRAQFIIPLVFCALTAIAGLSGCASAPTEPALPEGQVTHPDAPISSPSGIPGGDYGPPPPPSANEPTSTYGPEPVLYRSLVIVLGPGLARGYAYVGALRALEESKLPVAAILGTEMGAFVGALYAMDGKVNQLEWAMLKFRDGTFESTGSVLPEVFRRKARAKKLEEGLAGVFESRDLSQSKIPLRIALQAGETALVVDRGSALSAVRAAISDPELFGPAEWNGSPAGPATQKRPLLVAEARAMNLGPVVVIDASDTKDAGDADLVIRPNLAGIGLREFNKRTEAAFRGKSAVRQKIAELRHLVGLPAEIEQSKGNP